MCHHELTICKCCRTPIGRLARKIKCNIDFNACRYMFLSVDRFSKCTYCMGLCDGGIDDVGIGKYCNFDSKRTIVKDFYYPDIRK